MGGGRNRVIVRVVATIIIPVKNNSVQDQEEIKEVMKIDTGYILKGKPREIENYIGCLWNKAIMKKKSQAINKPPQIFKSYHILK